MHQEIIKKVMTIKDASEKGKSTICYELADFLKNYLVTHIAMTDKKYSPYLNSKGVY